MDTMEPGLRREYTNQITNKEQAEPELEKYFIRKRIIDKHGKEKLIKFKLKDPIESYMPFGETVYMYFFLLKYFSVVMFIYGLFYLPQVFINLNSKHDLDSFKNELFNNFLIRTSIGNLKEHKVSY